MAFKSIEKQRSNPKELKTILRWLRLHFCTPKMDRTYPRLKIWSPLPWPKKKEILPPGDDRNLYLRMKGALVALQGWTDARQKNSSDALKNLSWSETGPGSETYYFSARAYLLLDKKAEALRSALQASSFPPVYEGSHELAEELWKKTHGSVKGFEEALHQQRAEFAPQERRWRFHKWLPKSSNLLR